MGSTTNTINVSFSLILLGIVGMLLLAIATTIFFIVYYKRFWAQQEVIIVKELETVYQKDLLNAFIGAQEVERRRVAAELHDGIGSLLSALRLYLRQLSPDKPLTEYNEFVGQMAYMIDTAIDQTRNITQDLLPSTLDRFGVIIALKDLCKRIRNINNLEVNLTYSNERRLSDKQDLALYRIAQELINNSLKHAQATQIEINFNFLPTQLHMIYSDNGRGLAIEQDEKANRGLGLKSIASRAQLLNGKMKINSLPNRGFTFEIVVPIEQLTRGNLPFGKEYNES